MILVTGGTGLVGSHLLYHLCEKNDAIRAIYRTDEKREQVKKIFSFYTDKVDLLFKKIEWIKADITDVPAMIPAFNDVTKVYHCAALVSFDSKDYREMRKINIHGTAVVVNLSIAAKIDKLCFVSSIATVGDALPGALITEEDEWNDQKDNNGYAITKFGAEMEVWRASQEGVDVVVVNPGVILGSGFWQEGSGKLFSQINKGLRFYTEGITGFVGVTDVVKAMVSLMNSTIKNERYILVSENKSFKDILFLIAAALNKKKPSVKINKFVTSIFWRLDWVLTKLTGKKRFMTKNTAKSAHNVSHYSSEKIKTALSFTFEPMAKVIEKIGKDFER